MAEKLDEGAIARRLVEAGMSSPASCAKAGLFADALRRLGELSGATSGLPYLVFVPGRVEVLGKHTDYAGGRSLLSALDRGFCVAAIPRTDTTIQIVDAASSEMATFQLSSELMPAAGHWSNYPMTVARRVARNFAGPLCGANIVLRSDLPPAAGMSSSSAMMIAVFKVLAQVNRLAERTEYRELLSNPPALAAYLATIENGQSFFSLAGDRGVGTFGGSEDHTAICCCQAGHLHLFAFCPTRLERVVSFPDDYTLAIASSGVLAEKTGEAMAKYNRASQLVSALLELWNTHTGRGDRCLADVARSAVDAPQQMRRLIAGSPHPVFDAGSLLRRFEQFFGENEEIIPAACEALAQGDIGGFGALVDRSQKLAEDFLQNQVPQTIYLARAARQAGAAAASAFGAGFGGSVWAMVRRTQADEFLAAWADGYRQEYPAESPRSSFFASGAGTGIIEP